MQISQTPMLIVRFSFFSLFFCSVLEKSSALKVYDDLNDGSTTDGSISIIGEGEPNHRQEETAEGHGFETDELSKSSATATTTASASPSAAASPAASKSTSSSSALPLQMWMRCTPIDMSIQYSKRPLPPQRYEPHRCARPTSVAELSLAEHNIASDLLNYLDRLNNFMSRIYLLQVFLLFLSAGSIALLAIIYSRYSACKLEIKDLEQKLYSTKTDKYQIEGNLARCQYLYEMEIEKSATASATVNSDFKPATEDGEVMATVDVTVNPMQTEEPDFIVKREIQPTRRLASIDERVLTGVERLQTVWTGADDSLIATKKPRHNAKEKHFADIECADIDDGSLFSEYNREYCENQKKSQPTKVYATHYSYTAIDDGECNPNKIDFALGIDHARKILRETNCDDDGTLKYLEKAYENFEANTKNEQSTKRHKHSKRVDKTNAKWEKAQQKINSSVIKIDKFDDGSDESDDVNAAADRFERKEKRNRRGDKKSKRIDADNDDNDKENNRRRKIDRKDAAAATTNKKLNQDKDKDTGVKRNKNDRKRDMVKIYEHRHDYHHDD